MAVSDSLFKCFMIPTSTPERIGDYILVLQMFWGCGKLTPASSQTHAQLLAYPPQWETERTGRMRVGKHVG